MKLAANRAWIASGIAIAVIGGLVYALRPKPIGVDLAMVTRGPMTVLVEEEGRTRVKQVYAVSAPIIGRVLRSTLDAGDAVIKGQTVVAVIQPTDPPFLDFRSRHETEAQVSAASAAVDLALAEQHQAEGELGFAEADLTRNERLAVSGTVPERTLQKAQLEVLTRRAAVARTKAQVELRRRQLESERAKLMGPEITGDNLETSGNCCVSVKAPVTGRILKRMHESEKVVMPGTTLLEIGDTGDLEIVVELLSTDAVKVQPGAAVSVSGWGGNHPLSAHVRRIEPGGFTKVSALGIDEQRVRVIIDFDQLDSSTLGHDYRVYTAITIWQGGDVVRVPLSALFRHGKDWAVFAAKNGRAILTMVAIDHRTAEVAEVVRGLAVGDRVILHPSDRIADRSRITPRME